MMNKKWRVRVARHQHPRGAAADKMSPIRLQANRRCFCVVIAPVKDKTADLITSEGVTFHGWIRSANCTSCKKRKRDEKKRDDAANAARERATGSNPPTPPAAATPSAAAAAVATPSAAAAAVATPSAAAAATAATEGGGGSREGDGASVWVDRPPPPTPASTVHDKSNGGWAVLTNVITAADAATVLAMQPKEDKDWEGLFGTKLFGKGEEGEDAYEVSCHTSRRGMKELDKDKRPVATILAAIHTVLVMHGLVNDNHFVDATSLLLSLPGAPKQSYHHDFKDWTGTPGGKLFKGG